MAWMQELSSVVKSAPHAAARRLFFDRQAEFWLGELDPVRSLTEVRARVVRVISETPDTKTFVLRPNGAWKRHRAGQHATVGVEIDGVRVSRCYSVSSAPADDLVSITVKRLSGGQLSPWLHDNLHPGSVVHLSPPWGDFVLPDAACEKLLLLSGGSGITPVMSMLRDLARRGPIRDVVFLHHARSRGDVIFGDELLEIAAKHPGLALVLCLDDDVSTVRGFDEARFEELVPDFEERESFVCGPAPLMDRVQQLWRDRGVSDRLRRERFAPATSLQPVAARGGEVRVQFARSERALIAGGAGTLLEQLERAGARPPSACRMGICNTCTCTKKTGTVQNLITGEVSSAPDESIRLCVSVPRTDLTLDL